MHLLEIQEQKRQELKKKAEQIQADSDSDINWDDVEDLAEEGGNNKKKKEGAEPDIPEAVQNKLLSDYEEELKEKKRKGSAGNLKEELEASNSRVSPEKGKWRREFEQAGFSQL